MRSKDGKTCLYYASGSDSNLEAVRWLLLHQGLRDVETPATETLLTPFMSAVLKEQFEVADLLLTMGQARVDARNQHKETALQMATKMKNKARVVLFLRQRGAVDPSAPRPKPALSKVTIQQRLKRHTVVDKMKDLRDRRSLVKME